MDNGGWIMKIEKYLNEKKDDGEEFVPRGYKNIKVVVPNMCVNCKWFDRLRQSDLDICKNPINQKENHTEYNIFVDENGWCPQYKKSV